VKLASHPFLFNENTSAPSVPSLQGGRFLLSLDPESRSLEAIGAVSDIFCRFIAARPEPEQNCHDSRGELWKLNVNIQAYKSPMIQSMQMPLQPMYLKSRGRWGCWKMI